MKKLMIAAVIVCAAAISQGATISWSFGSMGATFNGEGSTLFDSGFAGYPYAEGATAYLFTGIAADYANLTTAGSIWNAFTADGTSSTLKVGDNTYTVYDTKTLGTTGTAVFKNQEVSTGANEYAAIVVTYTKDGNDYYSASTVYTLDVPLGGTTVEAGLAWGDGDYWAESPVLTTWSAASSPEPTPEPTSGLLLLLGVAGLALRRKRA